MNKYEKKALEALANESKELRNNLIDGDYFIKDNDGLLPPDTNVLINRLIHLLEVICYSADDHNLVWYDYDE